MQILINIIAILMIFVPAILLYYIEHKKDLIDKIFDEILEDARREENKTMKEQVEYFDTDFLGNKIEIGDKVILETPKYRDFAIGTVISKASKTCQIEYLSFNTKSKVTVRQYYEQLIKCPKEGKWIFKEYSEDTYTNLTRIYECSICGRTIECLNEADEPYCHCGAKMLKED